MIAYKHKILFFILLAGVLPLRAQSLQRVVASPFEPGSPAVIRFEWDNGEPITPLWRMGVVLPPEFDRTQLLLAASRSINGGFTVANSGDTLWVVRGTSGDRVTGSSRMDLSVASIGLPADLQKSYPFVFIIQDSSRRARFSGTMTLSREE